MDVDPDTENEIIWDPEEDASLDNLSSADEIEAPLENGETTGGPATAELIATRAELKRVETENAELKDRLARAPYDPFAPYAGRIKSCVNEPADAYAATVQRLLREAQDATPSPDTSRRP